MTKRFEAIAGGILFALILIVGTDLGGDAVNHLVTPPPAPPVAVAEAPPPEAAPAAQPPAAETAPEAPTDIAAIAPEPIVPLVAAASAEAGQSLAKACTACHTFEEGGANRVGPNLHGVVGRDIGAVEGFGYSPTMGAMPGTWDYETLDAFLLNPKKAVPGTKMAYAGLKKAEDRAALIAYLRSLSPNAPPLE